MATNAVTLRDDHRLIADTGSGRDGRPDLDP